MPASTARSANAVARGWMFIPCSWVWVGEEDEEDEDEETMVVLERGMCVYVGLWMYVLVWR